MVEVADEAAEGDASVVEALVEGCGVGEGVGGDAVVVCVEGFDKVGVEFGVEEGDGGVGFGERGFVGDDGFAEVEVDEACGGEFGGVVGEGGVEGALMVVVAVGTGVVFATDIDDRVAG